MSWNWKFAGLIAFSTILDYTIGLLLSSEKRAKLRKLYLLLSFSGNLGLLAFFKYYFYLQI